MMGSIYSIVVVVEKGDRVCVRCGNCDNHKSCEHNVYVQHYDLITIFTKMFTYSYFHIVCGQYLQAYF